MTATTALRRMGNSTGMIVPKAVLAAMGAKEGERLDIGVENGRLVAARAGGSPAEETITVTAEEAEALKLLARELNESAARMEKRLDETSAAIAKSLDPARETAIRQWYEREIAGKIGPDFWERLAR